MSGSNQAVRLQGMLSNIADSFNGMGDAYNFVPNAIRNVTRPEMNLSDSESINRYSDWARRNGMTDQADKYASLAIAQKKVEDDKAYKSAVAQGKEKINGFDISLANLNSQVELQKGLGVVNPALLEARDKVSGERQALIASLNQMGNESVLGTGTEGYDAVKSLSTERLASRVAQAEADEAIANSKLKIGELQDMIAKGQPIPIEMIPPALRPAYKKQLAIVSSGDAPLAGITNLNAMFKDAAEGYVSTLSAKEPATALPLEEAEAYFRRESTPEIAEWFEDEPELVAAAKEIAGTYLANNPKWSMAETDKARSALAREALSRAVKTLDSAMKAEETDRADLDAEAARAKGEQELLSYAWDKGMEPGGANYNKARSAAEEAMGAEFSQEGFDSRWNNKYFHPERTTTVSPTNKVMTRGPY
jgi:hypothetical protein